MVGFSGIVDLQMEEEFLISMKYKLKGGKILEDMCWQLKKIVKKVIWVVEKDKDKLFYNGLIILTDRNIIPLKNEMLFFLIGSPDDAQKGTLLAKFQV